MSGLQEPSPPIKSAVPPWGLAWRLAIGQVVAWGIVYYSFSVMLDPIGRETGWSRSLLNGGLSLGLLASGIASVVVGGWIQRRGGRGVMALGSLGSGLALMGFAWVMEPWQYFLAWLALGTAMSAVLYEPAFAVVTAAFGSEYRRGITLITLVGGFASTVFVPLEQCFVDQWGWRMALLVLGLLQIGIGLPLHLFGLPRRAQVSTATRKRDEVRAWLGAIRRDIRDARFLGLACWFTGYAAAFAGVFFQLLSYFTERGISTAHSLWTIGLIGPMQVAGRFALATHGLHVSSLRIGAGAMGMLVVSLLVLVFCPPSMPWLVLFAVLFGLGNGVMTILRGVVVAELFGHARYAELNGALALPALVARAASPFLLAACWTVTGRPEAAFAGAICLLLFGVLGLMLSGRAAKSDSLAAARTAPV